MTDEQPQIEKSERTNLISDRRRSFLKGVASIPVLGALSTFILPGRGVAAQEDGGATSMSPGGSVYNVRGHYFESCSCTTAVCPCLFLEDPTQGYCKAFPSWHIEQGNLGEVQLDGLNVAAWLHSPGNLTKGNWRLALYIDERATVEQYQAIEALWSGKHGGYLEVIAGLVSEFMGSKRANIAWKEEGKQRQMIVKDVGGVDTLDYEGADGAQVTVHDTPLAVAPPFPITITKSVLWNYHDYGVDMMLSGTTGLASAFNYFA